MKGWTQEAIDEKVRTGKVRNATVLGAKPAAAKPAARREDFSNLAELPAGLTPRAETKKRKYRNTPTVIDGISFDSKGEGRLYQQYKLEKHAGTVLRFLRQVPFHLPGGVIYRLDFLVFRRDERLPVVSGVVPERAEYIDYKGVMTDKSRVKIRMVQAIYGIEIKVVTRADL